MATVPFPMNLSPQGPNAGMSWELRSLTAINRSTLNGVATTLGRPGAHFALRLPYSSLVTDRRARLETFATAHRGSANRFHVPVFGWTRRGSFPATELLTNNTFASGTTGWTAGGPAITAADGLLRQTRTQHSSTTDLAGVNSALTVTQYAPYAARSIDHQGLSSLWSAGPQLGSGFGGEEYGRANATGFGLKTLVTVLPATTAYFGLVDYDTGTGNLPGDFIEFSYTSLARCALVDNGANFTQRSDEIDNAYWTKSGCTASTNGGGALDGSTNADIVTESALTEQHQFTRTETRSAVAADWCISGIFERGTGTRNIRLVIGRDSSNYAHAIFDLGAGTIALAAATSGDATNARAYIASRGGNRYFCAVVGKLTATTGLLVHVELANGTSLAYAGDGASSVSCWRVGAAQSSVPTRGMQTTSAGDSDGVAQTGSGLYLKGLPASTNGLLLQGDPAEIIIGTTSQLVRTRGALNSDAAGLGYWQFEPPLRVSPSDNAGVIIQNPLCKMMMENNVSGWTDRLGGFSDIEFSAVEDTYPS